MEISAQFLALVPIVLGVTQVIKKSGLSTRYAPLVSLVLGVVGVFVLGGETLSQVILSGLVVGLSSSGLYSQTTKTFNL